ncbi:MAG TPA: glycosyltransferase [Methylotenera sp.]|nr:glycosyltransferase [Methylotenera sp.]
MVGKHKIAYFINQYPKVSHSFIRREILALEKQGYEVVRIALRGWDADIVDAEDARERQQTKYVLQAGLFGLFIAVLKALFTAPLKFFSALKFALKMGIRADRSWPYHLIYLAEAAQVLAWLKDEDVQHIHAHFGTNSTEVVMLARLLGGPSYSFTVHGPEEFDKTTFLYLKEKIHHAAFVVGISSYTRSQLYRWADYSDWHKIHVVHCGLESSFHDVHPQPITQSPRLVCVGRICEQKGQLLLVNAFNLLAKKCIPFELVLAGDGEMREEIEGLISKYGLKKHITITGWISSEQVREQILAARALVLPSFAEGLPVVIMEALALRRPVLTTYVAGIPELVRDGKSGWLFPAGDVDELARVLEEFLTTPIYQLEAMGNAGYQRVLERHSIDTEAAKLSQLFDDAIQIDTASVSRFSVRNIA